MSFAAAILSFWSLDRSAVPAPHAESMLPAGSALSVSTSDDRLSVRATESPWPALLGELHRHTGVTLRVAPAPEGTVTVSVVRLPLDAVLRLLFGADASFVYVYRPAAEPGAPAVLEEVLITAGGRSGPAASAPDAPRDPDMPGATGSAREAAGSPAPSAPTAEDAPAPVASLWHEDPDLRRQALDDIVERGDGSGVAEVKQVLAADRDHEVRARAVKALTRIGTPEALEALRPAMSDAEVTVRLGAVDAIASFETARARVLLREALRDRDEQVRVSAATALRDLGSPGR